MNKNIQKIREILRMNNYPTYIINNIINKNTNTKNEKKTYEDKERIFYSVPFIPRLTENKTLRSMIENDKIAVAYKSNNTLRHLFTNKKTKLDKLSINNVVYEVTCVGNERDQCNKVYVGTTKRTLGTRLAEHEADIKKGKETTALAQHIKESGHKVDFKNAKILDKEKLTNKRFTLESLRIQQRLSKALNTKEDKDQTKLQYSSAIHQK